MSGKLPNGFACEILLLSPFLVAELGTCGGLRERLRKTPHQRRDVVIVAVIVSTVVVVPHQVEQKALCL
jgi:hypothetical protein